jgi:acetyl esterase
VPLDPQVLAMRERSEKAGTPPLYTLSLAQAREADLAAIQAASGGGEPVHEVVDRTVPGPDGTDLPVRIYRPSGERNLPVLVYFFGGGWTLGSIETSDAVCRTLANATGALVLAPGYRLAPEHKFPAAVHDCHAAVRWVAAHGTEIGADPARIAVGGDSAGGNLAAAVTLLAREGGPRLAAQLLVYPNTDYLSDTPSLRENTDPYLFNRTSVGWYWGHYLADPADGSRPLASPLRADDLSGLPPALVVTAEFDPLRDQAEEYAAALAKAGVPVVALRYDGMVHGFFCMSGELAAGRRALAEAAAFLRDRLA